MWIGLGKMFVFVNESTLTLIGHSNGIATKLKETNKTAISITF